MKLPPLTVILMALALPAAAQELTTATLDTAGSLTTGGDVQIAGSLGGIGGLSSDARDVTARAGFPGQIFDPVRFSVTPGAATVFENATTAFTAEVICDDDSFLRATALAWSVDTALLTVTTSGEVTAGVLPGSFTALLTASASGVTGTAALTVTDLDPDNYGLYAADSLPDEWQTLHFGERNPDATPTADPDADGQNNLTEYFAGTDPLDGASFSRSAWNPSPALPPPAASSSPRGNRPASTLGNPPPRSSPHGSLWRAGLSSPSSMAKPTPPTTAPRKPGSSTACALSRWSPLREPV